MGNAYPDLLAEEWQWLFKRAAEDCRILFRSGAVEPGFLDMQVDNRGSQKPLREQLNFHPALANDLHQYDRVHTYASFHIGDVVGPEAG